MAKQSQTSEVKAPEREKPEGGKTPHDGRHHQDLWPPNPPPSESAQAKADEDEKREKELHGE
jgi:hypothetical protein